MANKYHYQFEILTAVNLQFVSSPCWLPNWQITVDHSRISNHTIKEKKKNVGSILICHLIGENKPIFLNNSTLMHLPHINIKGFVMDYCNSLHLEMDRILQFSLLHNYLCNTLWTTEAKEQQQKKKLIFKCNAVILKFLLIQPHNFISHCLSVQKD